MKYRYDKGAHAVYLIQFHLVFCVKYRKGVLVGPVASRLKEIVLRIADSFGIEIIEQETDRDLNRVVSAWGALTHMERWNIPVRIFHTFRDIRWRWNKPCFKGGTILLDYRVFSIAAAEDTVEFNLWVSVSGTAAYKMVKIPFMLIGRKKEVLEELFPGWNNTNRRKALLVVRGRHIHISIPVEKEKRVNPEPAEVLAATSA